MEDHVNFPRAWKHLNPGDQDFPKVNQQKTYNTAHMNEHKWSHPMKTKGDRPSNTEGQNPKREMKDQSTVVFVNVPRAWKHLNNDQGFPQQNNIQRRYGRTWASKGDQGFTQTNRTSIDPSRISQELLNKLSSSSRALSRVSYVQPKTDPMISFRISHPSKEQKQDQMAYLEVRNTQPMP